MPRMTITISAERRQALKEAAARRGTTIASIIDQSLELAGIRTRESAADIVSRARARSRMSEQEAMDLALKETASVREPAPRGGTPAPRTGRR